MSESRPHVVIAGASGVIGRETAETFLAAGWRVTGLSRRAPPIRHPLWRHVRLDLSQAGNVAEAVAGFSPTEALVYAALHEEPDLRRGWSDPTQMERNLSMMRHLLHPLLSTRSPGQPPLPVIAFQGTKAYGVHKKPFTPPAKESWPRDPNPNFYWLQEDALRELGGAGEIAWTIFRPQIVFGRSLGMAMNVTPVLGAHIAMEIAAGRSAGYPGGPGYLLEAADAALVAEACLWAATSPAARNEIFNIANGDVFLWPAIWPVLREAMGLTDEATADPQHLAPMAARRSGEWRALAETLDLAEPDLAALAGKSDQYADFIFASDARAEPKPVIVSTIKLRQAGFTACVDTESMFRRLIAELQQENILPRPEALQALSQRINR